MNDIINYKDLSIMSKRSHRDTIISKDEILNLSIDLNLLTPIELNEKYFKL